MRILLSYVSRYKVYTGANHFTQNFFSFFQKTSHTLLGITFDTPPEDREFILRHGVHEQRETVWVGMRLSTDRLYALISGAGDDGRDHALVERIADAMREMRPDVFFFNGLSLTAYVLFLAARKANIPIVTVFHGLWFLEGEAYTHIPSERIALRAQAEKMIVEQSVRVIFHTPLSLHALEERVGSLLHEHVRFIPLPYHEEYKQLSGEHTSFKKVRSTGGVLRVGLVARWDPIKNHHAYLHLAQEAKRQGLAWEFFSVTTPSRENVAFVDIYDAYMQSIHVLPHMTIDALKAFYQQIDILLVPSHFETFCGVALEALLQGTPVALSPRVGAGDILREYGLERWIVDFSDASSALERIARIAQEEFPFSVRERLLHDLSPTSVFQRYEQVFLEI